MSSSVHRPRVDPWVAALTVAALGSSVWAIVSLAREGSARSLALAGALLLLWAILLAVSLPTRYRLAEDKLVIRAGLWRRSIPYSGIRRVYRARSLVAPPAWSLDRLAIEYRIGRFEQLPAHVSPADTERFLGELGRAAGLVRSGAELHRSSVPSPGADPTSTPTGS